MQKLITNCNVNSLLVYVMFNYIIVILSWTERI